MHDNNNGRAKKKKKVLRKVGVGEGPWLHKFDLACIITHYYLSVHRPGMILIEWTSKKTCLGSTISSDNFLLPFDF